MPWHSLQFYLLQMGSILPLDNKTSLQQSFWKFQPKTLLPQYLNFIAKMSQVFMCSKKSLRASESLPPGTRTCISLSRALSLCPFTSLNWKYHWYSLGWEGRATSYPWVVVPAGLVDGAGCSDSPTEIMGMTSRSLLGKGRWGFTGYHFLDL